jgi:hypothetical protein
VATLAWVGCVADTPEVAAWFGDDIAFRGEATRSTSPGCPCSECIIRHVGAGSPGLHRLRLAADVVGTGGKDSYSSEFWSPMAAKSGRGDRYGNLLGDAHYSGDQPLREGNITIKR